MPTTFEDSVAALLQLYADGDLTADEVTQRLRGVRPDYRPTFRQPVKGTFNDRAAIHALNVGSDAYVTERELNEAQWIRAEEAAKLIREMTNSGVLTESSDATVPPVTVLDNDELHVNAFALPRFRTVVNGWLVEHTSVLGGETLDRTSIRLPNPPVAGLRHDLVYIEYWLAELKGTDPVYAHGCVDNDRLDYAIIDERVQEETSRRVQLRWRIAVYEDYDGVTLANGLVDADDQPIPRLIPRHGTGHPLRTCSYVRCPDDPHLFRAGTGVPAPTMVDGWVYAIPLLSITRLNNSGYSEVMNPTGGVDYVDASTDCDRPDGKYSNIVYADQVKPMYSEAYLGTAQLNHVYLQLTDYNLNERVLRNKIAKLTYDLENVDAVLRAQGYALPGTHDLEVYGHQMFRQYAVTAGASVDDDLHKVIYRRRRYSVGRDLADKPYAVIPTLVDYDYGRIGALGDLYLEKSARTFTLMNTGAAGLRMDVSAFLVDGDAVLSGEASFMGMDGAIIQLPFTVNPDRHLVHICALEDTNGRNGEVFVRFVDQEMIVYNTGVTTNRRGEVVYTTANRFQWTVVDVFSDRWKNCTMGLVTLNGREGAGFTNAQYGERFRLVCGTPFLDASQTLVEGSIGEVYADTETANRFTVFNSGHASAEEDVSMPTVQCLVFHDVPFAEYYDTLASDYVDDNVPVIVNVPAQPRNELTEIRDLVANARRELAAMANQLSITRSQVASLDAMANAEDSVEITLRPGEEFAYSLPDRFGTLVSLENATVTLLVVDDAEGSPTRGLRVPATAVGDVVYDGPRDLRVLNVDTRDHVYTLLVAHAATRQQG